MQRTKIEWTNFTWNPVTGCSHGCYYCYARRMSYRLRGRYGYDQDDPFRPTWHGDRLLEPYYLKRPSKIFTVSMGEMFDKVVPDIWRDLIFHVMWRSPQHVFQVLTKQARRLPSEMMDEEYVPSNLWLGVTIDGQTTDTDDIELLWEGSCPAIRFVSFEPLLGPIDLGKYEDYAPDWIIIGAQTGQRAVAPKKEWVEDIIDVARDINIPIFLKNNLHWPEKIQEYPDQKSWRRTY